jgi:hypothetical protein
VITTSAGQQINSLPGGSEAQLITKKSNLLEENTVSDDILICTLIPSHLTIGRQMQPKSYFSYVKLKFYPFLNSALD